jgi:hypothetical protein
MSNVMSEFCKVRRYTNGEDDYYVRKIRSFTLALESHNFSSRHIIPCRAC